MLELNIKAWISKVQSTTTPDAITYKDNGIRVASAALINVKEQSTNKLDEMTDTEAGIKVASGALINIQNTIDYNTSWTDVHRVWNGSRQGGSDQ